MESTGPPCGDRFWELVVVPGCDGTPTSRQINIYLPPSRPNSVSNIGSDAPSISAGALIVQDDMARFILFGWPGAGGCDQGCCAANSFGRRARAESKRAKAKQDRAGVGAERNRKIQQAGAPPCPCGARDHRAGYTAGGCGSTIAQCRNTIDQCRDGIGQRRDGVIDQGRDGVIDQRRDGSQEGSRPELEKCQRQAAPGDAGSSACQKQRAEAKCDQSAPERKSRGLSLPAGRHGQSLEVIGPLAKVQFVARSHNPPPCDEWRIAAWPDPPPCARKPVTIKHR
jgi:hypothetical protein